MNEQLHNRLIKANHTFGKFKKRVQRNDNPNTETRLSVSRDVARTNFLYIPQSWVLFAVTLASGEASPTLLGYRIKYPMQ